MRTNAIAVLAVAVGSGCATTPEAGTWATASKTHRKRSVSPGDQDEMPLIPVMTAAGLKLSRHDDAPKLASGDLIDAALQDFLGARARSGRNTNRLISIAWAQVLERVDSACTIAPVGDDLGAFVRARTTLAFELHQDLEKERRLPRNLSKRLAATMASMDLRMSELRALGVAGTLKPIPIPGGGILVLLPPVQPLVVSSPFGIRTDPIHGRTRFHAGIDISAPFGAPVHAAAAGLVVYAGWQGGYGRHVVVDHGGGIRSHYSHMHRLHVKTGAKLGPGDTVGVVGATGRATGPHLHFAITNLNGAFLDPSALINQPFYAAPPEVEDEAPVVSMSATPRVEDSRQHWTPAHALQ